VQVDPAQVDEDLVAEAERPELAGQRPGPAEVGQRAVEVAVVLEVVWALYAAYVVHHYVHLSWRIAILNFVDDWAHAAVAIVVVTWLGDVAVAQYRERRT
jgi:hypothetical protein